MNIFMNTIEQSFMLLPLVLSMYFSYVILKTVDLTVDGTFVLGGCVCAKLISLGVSPIISTALSCCAGGIAGAIVGAMQRHNKIPAIIAGILAVFMLTSINLQIMGRPNITLLGLPSIVRNNLVFFGLSAFSVCMLMYILLKTSLGLSFKAFGNNSTLLQLMGKKIEIYRIVGLAISNSLVAYCGATTAQANGYSDVNMGFGLAITGIGTVIIGQQISQYIVGGSSSLIQLLSCFCGVFIYFLITNITIYCGINPINLKLFIGLSMTLFLFSTSNLLSREVAYG